MTQLKFSITEKGYNPDEVEKYFEMLQKEYTNAVEWGNEMERKLEEYKNVGTSNEADAIDNREVTFLKNENQRLLSDCRFLASKLKDLTGKIGADNSDDEAEQNQNFDIEKDLILKNAENQANQIIEEANKRAQEIMDSFYSNQQKIISEMTDRIVQAQTQIEALESKKESLNFEIENLFEIKNNITENINKAKSLLDF